MGDLYTTRYQRFLDLGKPGGIFSLWCRARWRQFEELKLGRPVRDDFEHNLFVLENQNYFDCWLLDEYRPVDELFDHESSE